METIDSWYCSIKNRGTMQFVMSGYFKNLHLRWYGVALVGMA